MSDLISVRQIVKKGDRAKKAVTTTTRMDVWRLGIWGGTGEDKIQG